MKDDEIKNNNYTNMENNIQNNDSEQTDAQKIALTFCMEQINKRLTSLGLDPREYNTDLVSYDDELSIAVNQHDANSDKTRIWLGNEADIRITLHELIHAIASEKRYRIQEESKTKAVKSGFHRGVTFKVINEAITEKIARELFAESYEENKHQIRPLFLGRSKKVAEILEQKHNQITEIIRTNQLNKYKTSVREERLRYKESVIRIKHDTWSDDRTKGRNIKFQKEFRNMQQRHHYQILHPDSPLGKLTRELELPPVELQQELLHKAYDIESVSDSYNEYVQLLGVMLECLGLEQSTDINMYTEQLKYEWNCLQEAYFTGNSLYFKRVKKLFNRFGIDLLRELERYNGMNDNDEIVAITSKLTGVKKQLLDKFKTKSKINTSDLTS